MRTAAASAPAVPHNLDAERAVLGAVILDNDALQVARETLSPSDFFLNEHGRLFQVMLELSQHGVSIDYVTLVDKLESIDALERCGGAAYVASLGDGLPRVSNVAHYAAIVREAAAKRRFLHAIHDLNVAAESGVPSDELRKRVADLALMFRPRPEETVRVVSAAELLAMQILPREKLLDPILSARSLNEVFSWRGVGKTWFALGLSHAVATGGCFLKWSAPKPRSVLFVDGELDPHDLQQRVKLLDAAADVRADTLRFLCCNMQPDPFPNLATPQAQALIESILGNAELLVLDNLASLAPSADDQESEDWVAIQAWFTELKRSGVSVIFLHHAGHAGWARGTTRREDLLDTVVELRWPKGYVAADGLSCEVRFTKTRGALGDAAAPLEVRLESDERGLMQWTYGDLQDERAEQVAALHDAGKSIRDIAKLTGIPKSTVDRLVVKRKAAGK